MTGEFDLESVQEADMMQQKQDGQDTPYEGEYMPTSKRQDLIIRTYLDDGLTPQQIADRFALHPNQVRGVISKACLRRKADLIREDIKEALFEEKVPVMEAIGDRGLVALLEFLDNFVLHEKHLKMNLKEAKQLAEVIEKLHSMYRLQLGKSTQNVAVAIEHSSKSMEEVLRSLAAPSEEGGDPFRTYPSIESVKVEDVSE